MAHEGRLKNRKKGGVPSKCKQIILFIVLIGAIFVVGCITPKTGHTVSNSKLAVEEAMAIAQDSECVQEGKLTDSYVYNENTRTWWIDIDPYTQIEGCNPACVVFEDTETAKIYWRCSGAQ
jgi:hypothetical protein